MTNNAFLFASSFISFFLVNHFLHCIFNRNRIAIDSSEIIIEFEAARGIFCYFVFIGHFVLAYNLIVNKGVFWPPLNEFKTLNHLAASGIDGFFFITGFLFSNKLGIGIDAKIFLPKRSLRLLPPLLICTAVISCLQYIEAPGYINFQGFYSWIIPGFTYADSNGPLIYGHYWSLRNEWIFYILILFLSYRTLSYKPEYLIFLLLALSMLDFTFTMILSGVIAKYIYNWRSIKNILSRKSIVFLIFIYYVFYLYQAPFDGFPTILRHTLRWFATFLIGLVLVSRSLRILLGVPFLNFISHSGTAAYSLYLLHGAALYYLLTNSTLNDFFAKLHFAFWPLVICPVWILSSWFLYLIGERPYWLFKRFLAGKRQL